MQVYLDNSATTRQYDEVTNVMIEMMKENFGNPSSLHKMGLCSEKELKKARKRLEEAMNASLFEIYFSSGGTEGDNTAIAGACRSKKRFGKRIITSKIEHPAVLETFKRMEEEGFEAVYIDVDKKGLIDIEALKSAVNDNTILISLMHVNNEVGTVQPIDEVAANKRNAIFHTDAVQSFGKIPLITENVDIITVSGHKIHGPKGIGGIAIKKGLNISPLILGGGQEKHFRSGTENMPACVGLGLAAEMTCENLNEKMRKMSEVRSYLLQGIKEEIKDIKINSPDNSCPSILNISFLGTRGEVILHSLEQSNIFVSTGSACSSNKGGGSHVLKAMGLSQKEIDGAIRFSFNSFNTIKEMDYVIEKTKDAVNRFRRLGSFR